jgi:TonB family protein
MTVEVESPDLPAQPRFTPMTVRPRILNAEEISAALRAAYPPMLRDAGIGGTVEVWFFVDEQGRVTKLQLNRTSGYDQLDAAAMKVASVMELSPAENRDQRVPAWVTIPITFSSNGGAAAPVTMSSERVANDPPRERSAEVGIPPTASELRERLAEIGATPPVAAPGHNIADQPVFTPMTQRPRILNTAEVERALTSNYPAILRNAGIGGTVEVWFFVDEDGSVLKRQLNKSSGYDQLDQAALRVADTIRMSPARNRDAEVPVWVSIPITFSSK